MRTLEPIQVAEVKKTAKEYPVLTLPKVKFVVMGEPAIIPNSLVTLIVHMRLTPPGSKVPEPEKESEETEDEEEEEPSNNKEWWVNKESKIPPVYAPNYPGVI